MQVLKAVAMMTFASILPVMTAAAPPSTGKDAAKPKLISTLEDNFTIRVLAPDSRGNLNLQNSNPLVLNVVGLARPDSVTVPFTGLANVDAPVFSLKNKKLIAGSSPATLLPKDDDGLSAFVFFPGIPTEPVDFIATEALDSYGNGFLRLGSGDGKNPFVVAGYRGGDISYRLDGGAYVDFVGRLNVTLAIQFV